MRQLVIGLGQVGSALHEVLSAKYATVGIDIKDSVNEKFPVVHVCIPFNDNFDCAVERYLDKYLAPKGLVVIHSTVAVGASKRHNAVHSPIRGVHPNLAGGIRTFEKFFGGARAAEAAEIFEALGITCIVTDKAENTEALKLWDTTYYGWNIIFEKAVKQYCDENGLDFDIVYTQANQGYNVGYAALGRFDVLRPVLKHFPGKIGGHCVVPNARILKGEIGEYILQKDEEYKQEVL